MLCVKVLYGYANQFQTKSKRINVKRDLFVVKMHKLTKEYRMCVLFNKIEKKRWNSVKNNIINTMKIGTNIWTIGFGRS